MGSLFDDLKQGLEQAIEYEKRREKSLSEHIYDTASDLDEPEFVVEK